MFQHLRAGIQHDIVRTIYHAGILKETPPQRKQPVGVGRNDPCPCGSGKKYKKCCRR
ncbi:SEC-C metal-binding domain-containing protein [Dehalococcoidia bacterium]|nr:SEC-C metal-binding domain-containing protein [Dehalococcoidia bacterium]